MTAAVPFPPALETAITEALERHRIAQLDNGRNLGMYRTEFDCMGCDAQLVSDGHQSFTKWDALAAHQAAVVMETIAQHMTAETLVETRAGLALANAAFGEGLSAGIRACNEAEDGKPFVKPVSPYSAPLLAMIRQEVKA